MKRGWGKLEPKSYRDKYKRTKISGELYICALKANHGVTRLKKFVSRLQGLIAIQKLLPRLFESQIRAARHDASDSRSIEHA